MLAEETATASLAAGFSNWRRLHMHPSPADFRNRGRWDDYATAVDEMFEKTSTPNAPWHLIPANQKKFARIAAMTHILEHLASDVVLGPPTLDEGTLIEAQKHFDIEESLLNSLRGRTD
jgi:hypothetical protein